MKRLATIFAATAILAVASALPAAATFPGAADGKVAFVAICDGATIGQAVYTIDPSATSTCPGGAPPHYTQATSGATDSMPYFTSDGTKLYFASNRDGDWSIYRTDVGTVGATLVTDPGTGNDFAPTVSADGSYLTYIHCDASGASCHLYGRSLSPAGSPTQLSSTVLLPPDAVSGAASRPEMSPGDADLVVFVDTAGHLRLLDRGTNLERDLSAESGVGTAKDEHPDWSPDGATIAFDSTRSTGGPAGRSIWELSSMTPGPATAAAVWGANDPGREIEPIYAPTGTGMVWTVLGNGSNLVRYSPTGGLNNASTLISLTNNRTNNSQPSWQPIPEDTEVPELPATAFGPALVLVAAAGVLLQLRRRAA